MSSSYRVTHRYLCTVDVIVQADSLSDARIKADQLRPLSWTPVSSAYQQITDHHIAIESHRMTELDPMIGTPVDPQRRDEGPQRGAGYD